MQFFSQDSKYYLALIFPLIAFLFLRTTTLHIIILSFYVLLICTGKNYKNYCNMAASLIIFPILILQNIQMAQVIIQQNASSNMYEMEQNLIKNYLIWFTLFEGIIIICLAYYSYNQYFIYRRQIYAILRNQ